MGLARVGLVDPAWALFINTTLQYQATYLPSMWVGIWTGGDHVQPTQAVTDPQPLSRIMSASTFMAVSFVCRFGGYELHGKWSSRPAIVAKNGGSIPHLDDVVCSLL